MCGRYTLSKPEEAIEAIGAEALADLEARYNIAPTQEVPVVRTRRDTLGRVASNLRWGLVPWWAEDLSIGNRMINARAETLAVKPAFRDALTRRRCGVLADGFVEWHRTPTGKQPFHIQRADRRPFVMAGLWERWKKGPDGPVDSFTIVTTAANDAVGALHDRMPMIVADDALAQWLDPRIEDPEALAPLLAPPDLPLALTPISRLINKPSNDDPACIEPVSLDGSVSGGPLFEL